MIHYHRKEKSTEVELENVPGLETGYAILSTAEVD